MLLLGSPCPTPAAGSTCRHTGATHPQQHVHTALGQRSPLKLLHATACLASRPARTAARQRCCPTPSIACCSTHTQLSCSLREQGGSSSCPAACTLDEYASGAELTREGTACQVVHCMVCAALHVEAACAAWPSTVAPLVPQSRGCAAAGEALRHRRQHGRAPSCHRGAVQA